MAVDGPTGGGSGKSQEGTAPHEDGRTSECHAAHSELPRVGKDQMVMSKRVRKGLQRNLEYLHACAQEWNGQSIGPSDEIPDVCHVDVGGCVHDVSEVFSVPRLCPVAGQKGLKGGRSYDILNGWNFLDAAHRKGCLEEIATLKPRHMHVSSPCGPFSSMQRLSKTKGNWEERQRKRVEGEVLLRFVMQVCKMQWEAGRGFSFEHPIGADSWKQPCVEHVCGLDDVCSVSFDQCCFGLKDPISQKLYKKGTRIITNNRYMEEYLGKKCSQDHVHEKLEGQIKIGGKWVNRTLCAQVYPRKMVEVMVKAIRMKRNEDQLNEVKACSDVFAVEPLAGKNESLEESVQRCHSNLGHPSNERFLHMLKSAGASDKALAIAKGLKCSGCMSRRPPHMYPVVKTRRADGFNQQVCMDTFEVVIFQEKKLKMLNMICEGTRMQICVPLWKGAKSKEVRKAYRKYWKRWAGAPPRVVVDGGQEFGGEIQEGFDQDNTFVSVIAAESPWQNGLAERHGGLWKDIFRKAFDECQPRNKYELNELCDKVCESKNSMIRKHGFSPIQHVFGCDLRIPDSLIGEHASASYQHELLLGVESHSRAQAIRQAARRALIAMDDAENVRKAVHRQSRPEKREFVVGDYAYYWKRGQEKQGIWKGPARVIGFFESKSKIWVSHGNKVLRCSPGQFRHLSQDQLNAVKMITTDMIHEIKGNKRGAQVFTDISGDGKPSDDDPFVLTDAETETDSRPIKRAKTGVEGEQSEMNEEHVEEPMQATMPEDIELGSEPTGETNEGSGGSDYVPTTPMEEIEYSQNGAFEHSLPDTLRVNDTSHDATRRVEPYPITSPATERSGDRIQGYGPIRGDLTEALRRSVDILDHGNTRLPRSQLVPCPETHAEAFEIFMTQLSSSSEIPMKDLTPEERLKLDRSKLVEWEKLIRTGSIKIYSGDDADRLRRENPVGRFLDSRFVKTTRENPTVPGEMELKCRWCIKGYLDPDLLDLQCQSPTLSMEGLSTCLQILASRKWKFVIADVEGAFLQGEPLERKQERFFVKIPREGIPGQTANDVVEVLKCVYGLCDAPRAWWVSFSKTLKDLGMKQSVLDPCVFYWFWDGELHGCISLHVDDMIVGGSHVFHEKVLTGLKSRYPFKHWKVGGGMFLGRNIQQNSDGFIVCDQKEYAEKIQMIKLTKERRKQKSSDVTEGERRKLRGVIGAANWMMGNTRPDIAIHNAFLQQRIQRATVSDLIEANKLVARMRDFSSIKIVFQSIPLEQGVFLVVSDASWANTESLTSQAGYMVCFSEKKINDGLVAKFSPLRWKSYKQDRHTQSTLGAELMGLSRAIAEAEWLRSLMAEAIHEQHDMARDKEFREKIPMTVTIDNKPIFDHTCGDGVVVKDKRMAIEMLIVRRDIRLNNITLRWVETKQMLVDCLTKPTASVEFLLRCLREGKYAVCLMTPDMIPAETSSSSSRGDVKCREPMMEDVSMNDEVSS